VLALLVASLAQAPLLSAAAETDSSRPLGVVMQAEAALIARDTVATGATVFDGDALATGTAGLLRVRFGSSQMYMLQDSSAVVHRATAGFTAELGRGTVVVSALPGQPFRLLADGVTIRPSHDQTTVAQVTRVNANELMLTSRKGALEVALDSEMRTIAEGTSYRLMISPEDAPQDSNVPVPTAKSSKRLIFIIAGAALVVTTLVVLEAVESPSKPR